MVRQISFDGAPDLESAFQAVSIARQGRAKRRGAPGAPPPFSLRLTTEERARLDREAGNRPLGAYIRSKLFAADPPSVRRPAARHPVKDEQLLARLLGELGQARIANNLNQLAKAVNFGALLLGPDETASLRDACAAVQAIRRDLMTALGLDGGDRP